MPQLIEVPGMGTVEFPDGMSDADIVTAIRRNMQPEQAQAPDVGMGEAALIAAGRGTDKLVQGVRQLYNAATGDQATLDRMAADEADKDARYKPLAERHPVATGAGGLAPQMAAGFLTGGTSLVGAAAANALPAILSYGSAEDRLKNATVDGALGAVGVKAGQLFARALKPAGVGAPAISSEAMQAAERVGYKPTAAQITQNPGMMAFENYLSKSPGSSGAMQRVAQGQQTALNRAAAKSMGQTADSLDEGVFAAAQKTIGGEFDRLSTATKPDLTGKFLTTLADLDTANRARGAFASKQIDGLIEKGLDLAAKNNLDGKAYKEIRSELANQAASAFKSGDSTMGQALKSLYTSLDDAAKGSLSAADQKAWDVARKEWAAFKTLTKSNVAEGGNVSAARTASAVRARSPGLRTGSAQGELADVARIGEAFKGVQNPNSGQLMQQMLYGNPFTGVPMAMGNKLAAAAYMSPAGQRYFSRGLLDVGEAGQGLLGRGGALLAIPTGRGLLGVE